MADLLAAPDTAAVGAALCAFLRRLQLNILVQILMTILEAIIFALVF